jgi:glycosyltransferase involved in cell wall biosynthesis
VTRIGFLWSTPDKAGERCIRRQVLGSRRFAPVVITAREVPGSRELPVPVLALSRWRSPLKRLWRKHVLGLPRPICNQEQERLSALTRKLQIRLVHVFNGRKAIGHRGSLRRLDIPFSVSFHGIDVGQCASIPELAVHLPELFARAACVMARSEFMARELARLGCPPAKLWINRTGIPLDEFPPAPRAGRPPAATTFIHAGRLTPKKGHADLIEAFARAARELPGARLWIAGEGPLRGELEARVARLGLGAAVEFLGFLDVPELVARLHAADLFVHPSVTASGDQEGIPNSMLEAMATGLPVVTTCHAGIPEAVRHGENGWLVAEGAVAELAERMVWCARNPQAVAAAGRRARELVEREHALELRMRLLDDKYEELIAAHAVAALPLAVARSAS